MISGLRFHHHGLALQKDKDAVRFLNMLGYSCGETVYDPIQDVQLRFCTHPVSPSVEIVMPGSQESRLAPMLNRNNQLLYHTCFEVDDRNGLIERLNGNGLRVIETLPETPAILFENRTVSFHLVSGFGLIELLSA